jgi:hypothetical protein
MTRLSLARLAVAAALGGACIGGCGHKPGAPGTGSDTGSDGPNAVGSGSNATSPHRSNNAASSRTAALVQAAFGGRVPAFPLLAKDGSTVAVGLESPIGRSDVSTYRVAIFTGWTTTPDVWGSSAQDFPIVDTTMATMLLDGATDEAAPAPDRATLEARAAAVTKHLTDGGFTPFDGPALALGPNDTAVGPAKLRVTHDHDAALTVHLLDGSGTELASNTILRHVMGHVADLECVSTPVARRAWLDAKRKRVLVEVAWNAGPEMCSAPDLEYGVWPVP